MLQLNGNTYIHGIVSVYVCVCVCVCHETFICGCREHRGDAYSFKTLLINKVAHLSELL